MELASLKSYQRTIASVDLPLLHFVETGFWNPCVVEGWTESDIGDTMVRRACREVARELKRPFIQCYAVFQTTEHYPTEEKNQHGHTLYATRALPEPKFSFGYVEIPKRAYLTPMASPLLFLPEGRRYGPDAREGFAIPAATLWRFRIESEELWNKYYEFALNDPDCRKARRLTS